jgi:hypothetical protein
VPRSQWLVACSVNILSKFFPHGTHKYVWFIRQSAGCLFIQLSIVIPQSKYSSVTCAVWPEPAVMMVHCNIYQTCIPVPKQVRGIAFGVACISKQVVKTHTCLPGRILSCLCISQVVAWVSGTCATLFKSEVQFGHAGAKSGGAMESAQARPLYSEYSDSLALSVLYGLILG